MPLGFGPLATFTTTDIGGGRSYTRLRGPILVGQSLEKAGWPLGSTGAPSIVNVSTQGAEMLLTVSSTFGASAGGVYVSTGAPSGLLYLSMTSGGGDLVAAASTANAPTGRPGGLHGAALVFDKNKGTLAIYDPLTSGWLWPHVSVTVSSSFGGAGLLAGSVITWTASSS